MRVWADPSGDPGYIQILVETLKELSPVLNLDFVWVAEAQATLKAYVGVPSTRNEDIGFSDYCRDKSGCASWRWQRDDVVTEARMVVWLDPDDARSEIKHVTIHEALHALAAIHHRPSPLSVMSVNSALRLPALSDLDESLLHLHGHPLVRPGMTMPEVKRLIVFADELPDPPPTAEEDGLQLAKRAYAALVRDRIRPLPRPGRLGRKPQLPRPHLRRQPFNRRF